MQKLSRQLRETLVDGGDTKLDAFAAKVEKANPCNYDHRQFKDVLVSN